MELKYIKKENDNYITINDILNLELCISSRLRLKLIKSEKIFLNGKPCDTRNSLNIGDIITINLDFDEDNSNILPKQMNLNILYEDEGMLIINKPAFTPVHPSMLHYTDSLSNGVRFYFDSIGLKRKIRPVNRLDKNTTGIVIFAKNQYIQECLIKQMQEGIFKKSYIAIVQGDMKCLGSGTINKPIARKENSIIERCVDDSGDIAITYYKFIKNIGNNSLIQCTLETGRTHQIRVHLAYIGFPILRRHIIRQTF